MRDVSPLTRFLREPETARTFDPEAWSLLLAEARLAGLLPRLADRLAGMGDWPGMPARTAQALRAASVQGEAFVRDVRRELDCIALALGRVEAPVLLLKGASYVALGLPAAAGRLFSDVDLLVAPDWVHRVEGELMLGGWAPARLEPYDERYYRQWAHEIPPMTHIRRGTTIDLHHSLVMPTCRIAVDSAKMIRAAIPMAGGGRWWRLGNEDIVLHSAAHLLLNGEFNRGLRDLWDIDLLYRHFSAEAPDFPERLRMRAREVGLERILGQALFLVHHFFATPLGEAAERREPDFLLRLLKRALASRHPATRPAGQALADWLLMLREVSLRLPPKLLLVHLAHKAAVGLKPAKPAAAEV